MQMVIDEKLNLQGDIKSINSECDKEQKKYNVLFKEIMEKNQEVDELNGKVLEFGQYCDRIKKKRDSFKNAWETIDAEFRKEKRNRKDTEYELTEKIKRL